MTVLPQGALARPRALVKTLCVEQSELVAIWSQAAREDEMLVSCKRRLSPVFVRLALDPVQWDS